MKIDLLKASFFITIILSLNSCLSQTELKSENKKVSNKEFTAISKNEMQMDFFYSKANKKVKLVLENNVDFLIAGKPTKAKFETENIDIQKLIIVGPGIMLNEANKDGFRFTITPIEKNLINGKLEIRLTEFIENKDNFSHKFLIPVKTKK